jgi:hypothetical protein
MNIDKYLYEIIDDYKNANSEEEKSEIFKDFCSSIWRSNNKRRVYSKTIRFKVRNDLLESEIGQIFNAYSEVNYIGYKEMTKDTDWCSLIRQKINNIYTRYFDEEVILKKDYIDLLKTPYNLYYRWIKGTEMDADKLTEIIDDSIYKANELKLVYQKQKMKKSWDEYKEIIESFLQKIFNNCKPIEDYEIENLTNKYIYELANEDNSYIKCFCDSLEGQMLDYQKKYYGLKRGRNKKYKRCKKCGSLIEISGRNTQYCVKCKREKELERHKKYNEKRKRQF